MLKTPNLENDFTCSYILFGKESKLYFFMRLFGNSKISFFQFFLKLITITLVFIVGFVFAAHVYHKKCYGFYRVNNKPQNKCYLRPVIKIAKTCHQDSMQRSPDHIIINYSDLYAKKSDAVNKTYAESHAQSHVNWNDDNTTNLPLGAANKVSPNITEDSYMEKTDKIREIPNSNNVTNDFNGDHKAYYTLPTLPPFNEWRARVLEVKQQKQRNKANNFNTNKDNSANYQNNLTAEDSNVILANNTITLATINVLPNLTNESNDNQPQANLSIVMDNRASVLGHALNNSIEVNGYQDNVSDKNIKSTILTGERLVPQPDIGNGTILPIEKNTLVDDNRTRPNLTHVNNIMYNTPHHGQEYLESNLANASETATAFLEATNVDLSMKQTNNNNNNLHNVNDDLNHSSAYDLNQKFDSNILNFTTFTTQNNNNNTPNEKLTSNITGNLANLIDDSSTIVGALTPEESKLGKNIETIIPSHSHSRPSLTTNYASVDCGAKILFHNPEALNPVGVLQRGLDDYMLNPCSVHTWFTIELCEPIQVKRIEIANLELFSSLPREFRITVSDRYPSPTPLSSTSNPSSRDWQFTFEAQPERKIQSFFVNSPLFSRYLTFELLSHYGTEHYCPLTLVRVFGTNLVEEYTDEDNEILDDDILNERGDMHIHMAQLGTTNNDGKQHENIQMTTVPTIESTTTLSTQLPLIPSNIENEYESQLQNSNDYPSSSIILNDNVNTTETVISQNGHDNMDDLNQSRIIINDETHSQMGQKKPTPLKDFNPKSLPVITLMNHTDGHNINISNGNNENQNTTATILSETMLPHFDANEILNKSVISNNETVSKIDNTPFKSAGTKSTRPEEKLPLNDNMENNEIMLNNIEYLNNDINTLINETNIKVHYNNVKNLSNKLEKVDYDLSNLNGTHEVYNTIVVPNKAKNSHRKDTFTQQQNINDFDIINNSNNITNINSDRASFNETNIKNDEQLMKSSMNFNISKNQEFNMVHNNVSSNGPSKNIIIDTAKSAMKSILSHASNVISINQSNKTTLITHPFENATIYKDQQSNVIMANVMIPFWRLHFQKCFNLGRHKPNISHIPKEIFDNFNRDSHQLNMCNNQEKLYWLLQQILHINTNNNNKNLINQTNIELNKFFTMAKCYQTLHSLHCFYAEILFSTCMRWLQKDFNTNPNVKGSTHEMDQKPIINHDGNETTKTLVTNSKQANNSFANDTTLLNDEIKSEHIPSNPNIMGEAFTQQQPTALGLVASHKESIFMRLNNRIKTLEANLSLTVRYLDELSRSYLQHVQSMSQALETLSQHLVQHKGQITTNITQLTDLFYQLKSTQHKLSQHVGKIDARIATNNKHRLIWDKIGGASCPIPSTNLLQYFTQLAKNKSSFNFPFISSNIPFPNAHHHVIHRPTGNKNTTFSYYNDMPQYNIKKNSLKSLLNYFITVLIYMVQRIAVYVYNYLLVNIKQQNGYGNDNEKYSPQHIDDTSISFKPDNIVPNILQRALLFLHNNFMRNMEIKRDLSPLINNFKNIDDYDDTLPIIILILVIFAGVGIFLFLFYIFTFVQSCVISYFICKYYVPRYYRYHQCAISETGHAKNNNKNQPNHRNVNFFNHNNCVIANKHKPPSTNRRVKRLRKKWKNNVKNLYAYENSRNKNIKNFNGTQNLNHDIKCNMDKGLEQLKPNILTPNIIHEDNIIQNIKLNEKTLPMMCYNETLNNPIIISNSDTILPNKYLNDKFVTDFNEESFMDNDNSQISIHYNHERCSTFNTTLITKKKKETSNIIVLESESMPPENQIMA